MLVLIAGFIGQFGRMLAEAIVKKARLKREKENKLEKAQGPESSARPQTPVIESSGQALQKTSQPAVFDKKAQKAMAKAAKKAAKAKEKESAS